MLRFCIFILAATLAVAACNTVPMKTHSLPTEPLPEGVLFLKEKVGIQPQDFGANSRLYIAATGDLFWTANNAQPKPEQGYWNTEWPAQPLRKLNAESISALNAAIEAAHFDRMLAYYPDKDRDHVSHPVAECWTVHVDGKRYSVVVEDDMLPPQLVQFKAKLDSLIAATPLISR